MKGENCRMEQQKDRQVSCEECKPGAAYDAKEVIDDVTVYKVYKKEGPDLWNCLLQAMGKM